MNTKTTIAAVLVAIALGVYVFFIERGGNDPTPDNGNVARLVIGDEPLPINKVTRLRIEQSGKPAVVFERDREGVEAWRQVEPVSFDVEAYYPQSVITNIADLRYTTTVIPADKSYTLEQLGLSPPVLTMTVSGAGVPEQTLVLGRQTGGGRAYVARGEARVDERVYIASDTLHQLIDHDYKQWRKRSLASYRPGGVRRVTLSNEQDTITLLHRDGDWTLADPLSGRASRDAALALAGVIAKAEPQSFVVDHPKDLAVYGLAEPSITLEVDVVDAVGNGAAGESDTHASVEQVVTHTLRIGGAQDLTGDRYFAMVDDMPSVFTLGKGIVSALRTPADKLRDPRLTPVSPTDVQRVEVRRGSELRVSFTRDASGWSFGDPAPSYAADDAIVARLVDAAFTARAISFVDLSAVRLSEPAATMLLHVRGRDEPERLSIYDRESGELMVVRADEGVGYVVRRDMFTLAFASPVAFRDRTVLAIRPSDIVELRLLRTGANPADYRLVRREAKAAGPPRPGEATTGKGTRAGDWVLEGYDAAAVQRLLGQVAPLTAEAWIAEPPVTTLEGATLHLTLADGTKHIVFIHPGSRTGTLRGEEMAFRVSPALVAATQAELRSRVVLPIDAGQIASISNGQVAISRDADGRYSVVGGGEVDEQKAAAWFNTIAGLTAEHFVDAAQAAGDPSVSFTVTTTSGETHKLTMWDTFTDQAVARLGDRYFTLPRRAFDTLLAQPIK